MKDKKHSKKAKEASKEQEQAKDYLDDLKRLQADFENYIKRTEKQHEESRKYANAELLKDLVNLKEDFERALKELKTDNKEVSKGLEMIYNNLSKILENHGIKEINAKGNKLDPSKHEVLQFRDGKEENIVLEEVQRGYTMHDKVLKTSKVIVSKSNAGEDKNE